MWNQLKQTEWNFQVKLLYDKAMKYGKDTAYMCQEGIDIDKLTESRLNLKIFVAKYLKPFFFSETLP